MKYYSLQNIKTGDLFTTLTGKVMVTTHRPPRLKGYRVAELIVLPTSGKRSGGRANRRDRVFELRFDNAEVIR